MGQYRYRQLDQYVVRVDVSGRVTVRNRRILRQYTPVSTSRVRLKEEHAIQSLKHVVPPSSHTPTAIKDDVASYTAPTPSPVTATHVLFTDDTLHDQRSTTTPSTSYMSDRPQDFEIAHYFHVISVYNTNNQSRRCSKFHQSRKTDFPQSKSC